MSAFTARTCVVVAFSSIALSGCGSGSQNSLPLDSISNRSLSEVASSSAAIPTSAAQKLSSFIGARDQTARRALAAPPTYRGCNIFAAGGYYNGDITSAATDQHSANYLQSLTATDNTGFYASTGIEPVNVASGSTALYQVHPKVSWHSFPVPYPWSSSFQIEPAGDAHLVVIRATPPACHLYEAYSASFSGNVLSAYNGANWDLSQSYTQVGSSSMASGLSLFAGSVRHEELTTGIHHALNFSVFSHAPCNCFTAPASATDGVSYAGPSTRYQMPYGAQLRLKADFNDSAYGPQSRAILEAMKHYGMYLADTGGHYTNNNAVYLSNPSDGGSWNQSDLAALHNLRFSDFDVLPIGSTTSAY